MFRISVRRDERPRDHFAHVEMNVLAALRDDRVDPPQQHIAKDQRRRGRVASLRIGQRIGDALERPQHAPPQAFGHDDVAARSVSLLSVAATM